MFPDWLAAAAGDPDIAAILDGQSLAFTVRRSGLVNDTALISRNIEAMQIRGQGYAIQLGSLRAQVALLQEEHAQKARLLEAGLAMRSEVTALRRALLEAEGQIGRIEAEISEAREMTGRFRTQIEKTLDEYNQATLAELQAVQGELESIREQSRRAENVLGRTDVQTPVSGTVVRLHYHTAGGVVESGKAIAEILPSDAPLIVEVLVQRTDIDSVREGQPATVRLIALNQRTTPVLNGTVSYLSADSVSDTSDGTLREVFVARVSLPVRELDRVPGFAPTPGMPAEILIQTAQRTFAQYLARPITDSMSRAFREQ